MGVFLNCETMLDRLRTLGYRGSVSILKDFVQPCSSGKGRKPTKLRLKMPSNRPYPTAELTKRLPKSAWKRLSVDAEFTLILVQYYQRRNHASYLSHCRRKLKKLEAVAEQEAQKRHRYPSRPPSTNPSRRCHNEHRVILLIGNVNL